MSFTDEYLELRKKRKKEEGEKKPTVIAPPLYVNKTAPLYANKEDIAPVKKTTTTKKEEEEERTWFTKGAFADGYNFGDVTKTALGTAGDVALGVAKGIAYLGEGVGDLINYGSATVHDMLGNEKKADYIRKRTAESVTDIILGGLEKKVDRYSVFGEKADDVSQGIGQVATIIATGGLAGVAGAGTVGATLATTGLMGASSMGSGMGEAYLGGATDKEAATYGLIKGVVDAGSELIFGGLGKAVKAVGVSKGLSSLDDMFAQKLASKITNQVAKNFVEYGIKASAEGVEEVLAGLGSAVGKKLTYMDEEELSNLVKDERLLEQFVAGAVTSGIAQFGVVPGMKSGSLLEANETGRDFVTGISENEQKVIDKEVENRIAEEEADGKKLTKKEKDKLYDAVVSDMEKGRISIDTIEEALGGETYQNYQNAVKNEDSLRETFNQLNQMKRGEMTGEQIDLRNELKEKLKELETQDQRNQLKSQLDSEVMGLAQNTRLAESYNERARKGQAFEADLTKYDEKQKAVIQKAIDSGILNNTNRTHEFVDMVAKISADKGVLFDFANNQKLKDSGFAIEGKTVNGFVTKDGVTLNIDSAKSLNSVVGHEITHVLEGTEVYTELQNILKTYAESKGEYQSRYDAITKLYEGIEGANIDAELTADLVGDYLFTDSDFINNLSTNHRNVFKKIYDEVKYLCKVATAGSKEAKQLLEVQRAFEKAYKEGGKVSDTKYSVSDKNIKDVSTGYASGETYFTMSYEQDGKVVGELNYGEYNGEANVKMIEVDPEYRRQGIGKKLLQELQKKYPDSEIDFGMSTPDGTKLIEAVTYTQTDEQVAEGKRKLRALQTELVDVERRLNELYDLEELTAEQEQEMAKLGERWDELYYTEIRNAQKEYGDKSESRRFVKYSLSEDSEGRKLSPAVQKRFANSKAVDENGNLKVLYHGTYAGEFSIFDKSKGYVEDDFGSGFYFSDNEADVAEHYEGGGPDYENKVVRLAERIADEEDIDMDEAEVKAREQLHKGSHKFEVYLNIENPAIVGKTILLDGESYLEQYNEEDYEDYDDYIGDVEQLVVDDIDNVVWEVEQKVDFIEFGSGTDDIRNILLEAYAEGGIGIEELKAKINELYLENEDGELVGNEVTRQIIESLGYDAVVDPTVSGKWNMNIEPGTTHYIVFKPNQIKAVTNENPTDNPDIHRSLSAKGESPVRRGKYNVFGKDIALETVPTVSEKESVQESAPVADAENATTMFPDDLAPMPDDAGRLESLTDADAPPEMEAPYYEDNSEDMEAEDPFEDRDWYEVSNRKVKAYMYEHPEVKPFFQEEAAIMLDELQSTTKGEKWYDDHLYYESGGEEGWGGTKRHTSDSIARMLDEWNMSYADIEKGLQAIIEDHGAENIAAAKKVEFMLNERLLEGYKSFVGYEPNMDKFGRVPQNQDYINMLAESQIVDAYSKESFDALMADADRYAPPISEEIAPVASVAMKREGNPTLTEKPKREAYEAIRPKPQKEPRMARATPEEQARASVLTEEPSMNKKKPSVWGMVKNSVLDKGMVFEDLSLATGNRELQARWNTIRYADGKAQRFMEKNLKPIIQTVEQSGKTGKFYEYLYHMHNADRMTLADRFEDTPNKPVFGDGVTAEMSRDAASKLEKANPEFKRWAQEVYNYNRQNRELLVEGGVISREVANRWEEMYPHYVPIRRVGDEGLNINVPLDTGRTGVNAPIKKATGGNRDILPLFDTMGQRTMQTYKAIAKNRFGVELKNTMNAPTENEAFLLDEVIDGIDAHEELLQEGKNGQKPTFTVFENGEKVTFEITDEMYDAMKPKNKAYNKFNESRVGKVLSGANNIRRGLLTEYNPAFMFTNPIKDAQDVLLNSQHPARTYANFPKAVAQLIGKKGHWYNEYMDNGGEQNTYFESDTNTFAKEKSALRKAVGFPLDKISDVNNFIERVPRMAEYIASRKAGASVDVAMLDAARVTTNFAAGGDLTKFLNRNGVTFLNASVQGAVQQVRNVREAKANGVKGCLMLAAKMTAAGLPSILLNHLFWDDDEEYAELSDYVKQNYYIAGKYGDGKFVRIPKGRALAVIQNGFEQMENLITGDDITDLRTFGEQLWSSLMTTGKMAVENLAPNNPLDNNIIAPVVQTLRNRTWYEEDLVPTRLQDLPAAEQYDETTDEISKWLGEKTNISPYKINYLLDQYSGGVGDTFLPMITPEAERGNNTLIAPLADKLTTDSVMKNQNVSDFYDKVDELTVNANSSKATDEDVLKSKYMNSINGDISDLYKQKREIQNSNRSDAEKYKAVREVQRQINALAEESLNTYEDIRYENDGEFAIIGDRYFQWYTPEKGDPYWRKLTDEQTTKYKITSAAGDAHYATDGTVHYRLETGGDWKNLSDWTKISDKQLERQNEVTKSLGISPEEYWSKTEISFMPMSNGEYEYAYDNPGNYAVSKAVGGYDTYAKHSKELNSIRADKDKNGKSINGSAKEKKLDYINSLDIDYGARLILFKSEYPSDDTYNMDIINYLNSKDDLTYEDRVTILKELDFEVDSEGNVYW